MFLNSNIKFLRNYARITQAEFGKLFGKTRSNIDSYERGIARPDEKTQKAITEHFNISLETLIHKDLQKNPGLLLSTVNPVDARSSVSDDAINAKDEVIRELRAQLRDKDQQINFLQNQNDKLLGKLKVA